MVAKNSDGSNAQVPGIILSSKNELRRFLKSIKRIELKHERHNYSATEEYTDGNLDKYNVQVAITE